MASERRGTRLPAAESAQTDVVEWAVSTSPVAYPRAVAVMEERVARIRAGSARELVWLLEHPPLYTAGASARAEELLEPGRLPVYATGRGGRYTYHGPGQRIVYVMLDLNRRGRDVRAFVGALESWLIAALARLGVVGETRAGRIGIWVRDPRVEADTGEAKIAAIGLRLKRWVSLHGLALNVDPDLAHFTGIVPCGIADSRVTSLSRLGIATGMSEVDRALRASFEERFGPTYDVGPPALGSPLSADMPER
ncbi:MAG TPA: lipoyl(octanoyl) transferase LipB [Hyphomicrobiaceae bacterium]|nr:lipoyl(octanoyl) transferase LipB [Hyphomicrobiaceae bacterium]